MKILILQDDFPPISQGGAGAVAFNIAKGLLAQGHQVAVICAVQDRQQIGMINYEGIEIYRIFSKYHERWRAYKSLNNKRVVRLVELYIKKIRPDVVHAHNIHYHLSYASLKVAKKYCLRVVMTLHDVMAFHYGKLVEFIDPEFKEVPTEVNYKIRPWQLIVRFQKRYNPFRNTIIKHYLRNVDQLFSVSQALKKALAQNRINSNIDVVHNGIDVKEWQIDQESISDFKSRFNLSNKKIIFFSGRLTYYKGGDQIFQALEIIKNKVPNACLIVAGEKQGYLERLMTKYRDRNLPVILLGWLIKDEMKLAYAASDVVVLPSVCFDAFPTTNLEAMAMAKPIVGTCFGGTPEIVEDQKTGYIVNPYNIENLAGRIINLLSDDHKARQMGQVGYDRVRSKFSLKEQVDKILEFYL